MRSLFRAFEKRRVRYLIISGQASVLYGAALFSQDLDLWVDPTPRNIRAMLRALSDLRARYHKLTPPLTVPRLRRGHGFHFVVPPDLYLDVMGQPPRVGRFAAAIRRAQWMKTPWGRLPVVSIEDLVEIKKTNRPADYEVITRLVLIRLQGAGRPSAGLIRWANRNLFTVEATQELARAYPGSFRPVSATVLARRMARLQDLGRRYWMPRLHELKKLRAAGKLIPEGSLVTC